MIHPRDPGAPSVGGIQTFLQDFIKYSPPEFEITFAGTTSDRKARPIGRMTRINIAGREATVMPIAATGGIPRDPLGLIASAVAQLRLRALMLRGGRILQVHRPYRPIFLTGHRGPRVQFVHVDIREWPGPSAWGQLQGMYREFSDSALSAMAQIFVVNEPGAELLRREHPAIADRVSFLPGWFDPQTFRPPTDAAERAELRKALLEDIGAPDSGDEALVLFAGRLEDIKAPLLALQAWAQIAAERPTRLIVCGSGELAGKLESEVDRLGLAGRVHFLGDIPRERLSRLMRATDVLLCSSVAEGGGPRVVLEALGSGTPVVTTVAGEVRRTVKTGSNGWISESRTADELADGLRWSLAQPRDVVSVAAVEAVRPFQAATVLQQLYDAYREIAAGQIAPSG